MTLRAQLTALVRLSEIDATASGFDKELAEIPRQIEERARDAARLESLLARESAQLEQASKTLEGHNGEIARLNEVLAKAKSKTAKVKTAREADLVERELENARRSTRERETERTQLIEAIEKQKATLEAHRAECEKLAAMVQEQDATASARRTLLEAQRAETVSGRGEYAAKVAASVLRRYDQLRQKLGFGVVEVMNGTCSGCRLAIPPQMYNALAKGDAVSGDEVPQCPHCRRIVFVRATLDE